MYLLSYPPPSPPTLSIIKKHLHQSFGVQLFVTALKLPLRSQLFNFLKESLINYHTYIIKKMLIIWVWK